MGSGEELVVVGSVDELYQLSGERVTDLHRHFIDHLTIPSRTGRGMLRRIEDVFDCWFESGERPAFVLAPWRLPRASCC